MRSYSNVLLVDGPNDLRNHAAEFLVKYGYRVVVTDSVESALADLGRIDINSVVLELVLPGIGGMGGITLIADRWPEIGIVAMTAGSEDYDADVLLARARRVGAHRILKKPFGDTLLLGTVNSVIQELAPDHDRPHRVVVVDDSPTVLCFVTRALQNRFCAVATFASMEEALASPEMLVAELVITDIFMPGIGGISGILQIRETWPHLPVIAMSGGIGEGEHRDDALTAARRIGANAVLRKPFGAADLVRLVDGLIGPAPSPAATA